MINRNHKKKVLESLRIYLFLNMIIFIACSCNWKEKRDAETRRIREQRIELEYIDYKQDIQKKYGFNYELDTLNYSYSIQFEEVIKSKYQLITNPIVHDIYKKDTLIYITLLSNSPHNKFGITPSKFHLELVVSNLIYSKIKITDDKNPPLDYDLSSYTLYRAFRMSNFYNPVFFIVKLNEIQKYSYKLDSYIEPTDEYYDNDIVPSNTFFCKGNLIDVIYAKIPSKEIN